MGILSLIIVLGTLWRDILLKIILIVTMGLVLQTGIHLLTYYNNEAYLIQAKKAAYLNDNYNAEHKILSKKLDDELRVIRKNIDKI
jgi:hypothetical protein